MTALRDSDRQRRQLIVDTAAGFAADLERVHPKTRVPGLAWTVDELAAHLVSLPSLYRQLAAADPPLTIPRDFDRLTAALLADVGVDDPTHLGRRIVDGFAGLSAFYGDDPSIRYHHWGRAQTVEAIEGIMLNELLIHRWDLARAIGGGFRIQPVEAMVALDALLPATPAFVDPNVIGTFDGVFHLHLRGSGETPSSDWIQTVADGGLTVSAGRPAKADLRVSAEPVSFLLVGFGRLSRTRAALSGKIRAYGRKPWLATKLASMYISV